MHVSRIIREIASTAINKQPIAYRKGRITGIL